MTRTCEHGGVMTHYWMRHESRRTERRAPLTPEDASRVVAAGHRVTVERSPQRVFGDDAYAAAGCALAATGSWVEAPDDAVVLGLKELPDEPTALAHTHVFFGHAYKGQEGAGALLDRFARGGGRLLDIEYLAQGGRRVVAFGYWAGYVGAALAILQARGRLEAPLQPMERAELDRRLLESATVDQGAAPSGLVIGAAGRSGTGARDALALAGVDATGWDLAETATLDRDALLAHDLLVNCVGVTEPAPPFVTDADLDRADRRLRTIADVTADFTSDLNLLPVNDRETTWEVPVRRLREPGASPAVDMIAIDNLPSLLPREASTTFSADLLPHLLGLQAQTEPWQAAQAAFDRATGTAR